MEEFLNNYEFYKDVDLVNLNTYRVHSICEYLIYPRKINELINIIKYLKENSTEFLILGNGSNIILSKQKYKIVIKLDKLNIILIKGNIVEAECGVNLVKLLNICTERGLSGLEFLTSIPGQVGASTKNNTGAFEKSIGDYVIEVKVLDENYNIVTLENKDIKFKYRSSIFKETTNLIVVSTTFKLNMTSPEIIKNKIIYYKKIRLNNQPYDLPNAGCVFKNPKDLSAGKLIESLSLRGYNIGGAMVSKKHANFIVNKRNATGEDIINLIEYIKEKVKLKYNIELELEQEIV